MGVPFMEGVGAVLWYRSQNPAIRKTTIRAIMEASMMLPGLSTAGGIK